MKFTQLAPQPLVLTPDCINSLNVIPWRACPKIAKATIHNLKRLEVDVGTKFARVVTRVNLVLSAIARSLTQVAENRALPLSAFAKFCQEFVNMTMRNR